METSAHPLQSWFPLSMRAKQATAQALNATITAVNRLTQPNSRSGRPQCGECAEHDLIPQGTGARTFASDLSDQSNAATSYDRGYAYLQLRECVRVVVDIYIRCTYHPRLIDQETGGQRPVVSASRIGTVCPCRSVRMIANAVPFAILR
jgi:hypothetical protein